MPMKAKLAKEECWYFVKTGRRDFGWTTSVVATAPAAQNDE
jgi:hypothetical protein